VFHEPFIGKAPPPGPGGAGGRAAGSASGAGTNAEPPEKNRDKFMAAYNLALDRGAMERGGGGSGGGGANVRLSSAAAATAAAASQPPTPPSSGATYTALPRADLSFSVLGYQTPTPSSASSRDGRKNDAGPGEIDSSFILIPFR